MNLHQANQALTIARARIKFSALRTLTLRTLVSVAMAITSMATFSASVAAQQTVGHVTWSPDGKYLAFYSRWYDDTEIFLVDLEKGNLLQQTANDAADSAPAFTFDSQHLLFSSNQNGSRDIYRVDLLGGEPERLFGEADVDELFPYPMADGRIAYTAREVQEEGADRLPFKIRIWDPATGNSQPLAAGDSDGMIFRGSMDGANYLLASNRSGKTEIYLTDVDGNIRRQLTDKGVEEGVGTSHPRFLQDGRHFLSWGDADTGEPFSFMLKVHNLETGEVTVLPRPIRFTAPADLSPDGSQVAFAAASEEEGLEGEWHLYIMNLDGTDLRLLY